MRFLKVFVGFEGFEGFKGFEGFYFLVIFILRNNNIFETRA